MTPDQALAALLEGNARYVRNQPRHPHQRATHRRHTAAGQHPFAVVLGCADSRVPPEIIFDEGIGDLFVVRTAGHIVDDAVVGSIEYAFLEFGAPLVLVLGHERCGAVKAALETATGDRRAGAGPAAPAGHIGAVVEAILPAIRSAGLDGGGETDRQDRQDGQDGQDADERLDRAVRANVAQAVETLRADEPLLAPAVRAGRLRVVGARYDLNDGVVAVILP